MILLKLTVIAMLIVTILFILLLFVYFVKEVVKEWKLRMKQAEVFFEKIRDSLIYTDLLLLGLFSIILLLILFYKIAISIL